MAGLPKIIKELRRRRVFRVGGIYIVAAWVVVQVASEAFPGFDIPAQAIRYVWIGAIAGFPVALLFGWFYDITPQGVVRTKSAAGVAELELRRVDYVILAALSIVAVGIIYQSTRGIQDSDSSAVRPTDQMSIAVLPLDNLSGDPQQAYFVNGMQDALITELSRISGLRVTSRTSTLAFADTTENISTIGRILGVDKLIEGSVYRVGDRVRIVVQLIDAEADAHLWTETYERDLVDVLRMQSDITRAIAEQVQVTLTADETRTLAGASAVDAESYESYLKGMFHVEQFTPEGMALAVRNFETAIAQDPDNALAYWGLNRVCRFQLQAGLIRPREGEPRCRAPLMKALELDSERAEVHLGLALGFWAYDYDWDAALAAFNRAFELNPNYAEARMFYSHLLSILGRSVEGTEQMLIARELDPLNPFMQGLHGAQIALAGSLEEGIAMVEASLEASPGLGFGYDVLWGSYARLGRWEESYEAARNHFGITMGNPEAVAALERGYAEGGYQSAMLAAADVLVDINESRYIPAVEISTLYELGGDIDKAIEWLEIAYDQHDPTLPYVGAAPLFNAGDVRYHDMLRRMNLEMWIPESP